MKWVKKGQKNTRFFFFNLEKSGVNAKVMDSIKDANGLLDYGQYKRCKWVTSQKDILSVQRNYFADLCKKKVSGVNMMAKIYYFMKDTSMSNISGEKRKSCEGALLENKVLSVLKQMKARSAPGSDGLTVEFLKSILVTPW